MSKSTRISTSIRNPVNTAFPQNHFRQIKQDDCRYRFFLNLFSKRYRNRIHFEEPSQTSLCGMWIKTLVRLSANFVTLAWAFLKEPRFWKEFQLLLLHKEKGRNRCYISLGAEHIHDLTSVASQQGGKRWRTIQHWIPGTLVERTTVILCTTKKEKHCQLNYDTPLIVGHALISDMLKWEKLCISGQTSRGF